MAAKEGNDDDLIITRAAARAWYYRGPGSNKNALRERENLYEPGRNPWQPPARDKISAKGATNNNKGNLYKPNPNPNPRPSPLQSKKSSLLDSYEIEMISRQLNRFIESSQKNNKNLIVCRSYTSQAHPIYQKSETIINNQLKKKKKKKKKFNGGLWSRYPMICGTLHDKAKPNTNHSVSGKVGSSCDQTRTRTSSIMHLTSQQSKGMPRITRIMSFS